MLNEEYCTKLVKDAFSFMRLIGGAEKLDEKGFRHTEIMDGDYMEEIEDFLIKWLPEEAENIVILKTDDCLEAEAKLTEFFTNEILEIMR